MELLAAPATKLQRARDGSRVRAKWEQGVGNLPAVGAGRSSALVAGSGLAAGEETDGDPL